MKSLNTLEFIGASLTIVGSLLPWKRAGDFLMTLLESELILLISNIG
jgi:hypothetical protein